MQRIRKTIEINAPVQRVFDFIRTPSTLPSYWPTMLDVRNVADQAGGLHEFDWTYKMAGVHIKGHAKELEVQPGRLVRVRNDSGIPSTFVYAFEGLNGAGTKLTLDVEYTIPTPVIGKLAEALVARLNERDIETMLVHLKEITESGATSTATAAVARPH